MAVKVREWKGAWWIFTDYKGRRKAKRVGEGREGKRAAQTAAQKIQAKLALGDLSPLEARPAPAPAAPEPLRFAALAEDWLAKYPLLYEIRPNTLDNYRSVLRHHVIPFFGAMGITEIRSQTVEDFIAAKLGPTGSARFAGQPLSRPSVKVALWVLQMVLQRAVRAGEIPANPAVRVGRFRRVEDENVDPFTGAELRAILEAASRRDPDLAALLRLWAQTGLRAGEVCGLQWHDVDFQQGTVVVRRTWSRQRLGPPKTGRVRVVSLLHPVVDDTPEWRPGAVGGVWAVIEGLRRLRVRSLVPEAFVFTREGRPWATSSLNRAWRQILAAAGVRYRSPEQLRHTFASTMLSRNAPLLYVQQQGGWRSAAVLLRVYARWMPLDAAALPAATQPQPEAAAPAWDDVTA
jgi:integrase